MTTSNPPDIFAVVGVAGPRDPVQEGRTPDLLLSSVFQRHMKAVFEYFPAMQRKGPPIRQSERYSTGSPAYTAHTRDELRKNKKKMVPKIDGCIDYNRGH
jgi:hypothetical protein